MNNRDLNLLLVEDNDDEAFLIMRALRRAGFDAKIACCQSARSARRYLDGKPHYDNPAWNPAPDLVLLDLALPDGNGLEFLDWVRSHLIHQDQLVVILTSSAEAHDIQRAHELRADGYLIKPSSLNGMVNLARTLRSALLSGSSRFGLDLPEPVSSSELALLNS
jgi:DNA-binding response OmpR family regulator